MVEVIWLITSEKGFGNISSPKCDSRQINTTGKKTSGTSSYEGNINPELVKYLTLNHTSLVILVGYVTRMKVYDSVRKEILRKSSPDITTSVRDR